MIKNDKWIKSKILTENMIDPFSDKLIRSSSNLQYNYVSYGLSSYGYDIRLSEKEFKVFNHVPGTVVDPKNFNVQNLTDSNLHRDDDNGLYYILPAHSYGLGVAYEKIKMPCNVTGLCIGKSTYARCGIIANITPIEAGWEGYLTLEFSNSSNADCRLYVLEGIVQVLFFEGEDCETTYKDRNGKYQDQKEVITLPIV